MTRLTFGRSEQESRVLKLKHQSFGSLNELTIDIDISATTDIFVFKEKKTVRKLKKAPAKIREELQLMRENRGGQSQDEDY